MSEQAQEWTADMVKAWAGNERELAKAINAALAAEREKFERYREEWNLEREQENDVAWGKRLAAERETSRYWKEQWVERGAQLAAERDKLQIWLNSFCFESLEVATEELDERQHQINNLQQQLAAERNLASATQVELDGADRVITKLKQELAAEKEKGRWGK